MCEKFKTPPYSIKRLMYKIYKTNSSNPGRYGKRMRILYSVMVIIPMFGLVLLSLADRFTRTDEGWFTIAGLVIMVSIAVYYFLKTWIKSMKEIGDIKFTRNGIEKSIGGITEVFLYPDIENLKIEKYMQSIIPGDTWKKYSKYVLAISVNSRGICMIVGDKSSSHLRVSILDSMRHLKQKNL